MNTNTNTEGKVTAREYPMVPAIKQAPYREFRVNMIDERGKVFRRRAVAMSPEAAVFLVCLHEQMSGKMLKYLKFVNVEDIDPVTIEEKKVVVVEVDGKDVRVDSECVPKTVYPHDDQAVKKAFTYGRVKPHNRARGPLPSSLYMDHMARIGVYLASKNAGALNYGYWRRAIELLNESNDSRLRTTISGLAWNSDRLESAFKRAFGWHWRDLKCACDAYQNKKGMI